MAAPRPFPAYPKNPIKSSGGARIKIAQKAYYLGRHGSPESYREYERLRLEHAKGLPPAPKLADKPNSLTVEKLLAEFLRNEPRGATHPQIQRIARACVPMLRLFGTTPADEFRANRLRAVQESMIDQRWMTDDEKKKCGPWSREYINKSIERIIRVFNWGESRELLPMNTAAHLRTVESLKLFDKRVKSCPDVKPVDWEKQVKPCLEWMNPVVRAMVQVQYLAGMRPSEVCNMRRCEVDTTGEVWLYTPTTHKGTWREHELIKAIGPRAQVIMAPWLMAAEPDGFVFPPAKRRNAATRYEENGYGQAIRRAIKLAGVEPWHAYGLRHACGHNAQLVGGLPAIAAMLGQHSLETSKIYSDKQRLDLAKEVAKKIG